MLGAGFILLAKVTPWHTDSTAYFATLNHIREQADVAAASPRATDAFFANVRRYTHKWLFADIGYLLVAWSAVILLVFPLIRTAGPSALLRTRTNIWLLLALAVAACCLVGVSFVAGAVQAMHRQLIPEWADSIGIVFNSTAIVITVFTPPLVLAVLGPCLFQPKAGEPILILAGQRQLAGVLVTLLYAPFVVFGAFLIAGSWETGGWASSITGVLICWLALNARALALGPRRSPAAGGILPHSANKTR
jgi:hypothetical protein